MGTPMASAKSQIPEQFEVSKLFKTETQGQSYFNDTEQPPLIAVILMGINFLARIVGTVGVLIIIMGGIVMISSTGNETMINKGKDMFKYAIVGVIVALLSYIITTFFQTFLS